MIKKIVVFLILITTAEASMGQDKRTYLKDDAVPIIKFDSLSKDVYDLLINYRLIMIGEIHGTNEPINLLDGLVSLLTKYGDSVQVGFEIPSEQMTTFLKQPIDKNILKTTFFSKPSGDGRASVAWYKKMAKINNNKKVKIFFFDNNIEQGGDRDSVMYLNIKSQIIEHSNWKTITISGGTHNRILPFNGQKKIGNFLMMDKELNISESLCSLNHEFESGETLWNEFKSKPTIYSKLGHDKYLLLFPKDIKEAYQGIFFTKYLTKSESAIGK